jgi:hypothetical protein
MILPSMKKFQEFGIIFTNVAFFIIGDKILPDSFNIVASQKLGLGTLSAFNIVYI